MLVIEPKLAEPWPGRLANLRLSVCGAVNVKSGTFADVQTPLQPTMCPQLINPEVAALRLTV